MNSTDLIPLKNSLKNLDDASTLKKTIQTKIESLPNYQSLKGDVELILYACNTLENAHVDLKASKVNKRQLIVSVFSEIFNLNDEEKFTLSNTIQFLFDHHKIKQIKKALIYGNVVKNWFIKKFG